MSRFRVFWIVLCVLLIVAGLAGAGLAAYRYGFDNGYAYAGQVNGGDASAKVTTPSLYPVPGQYFYPGYGMRFHHPFGTFFGIAGFIVMLFLLCGVMRMLAWKHWAGAPGHAAWRHGPYPGWYCGPYPGSPEQTPTGEQKKSQGENPPAEK